MPRPSLSRIFMTASLLLTLAVPVARAEEPAFHATRGTAGFFSLADLLGRAWEDLMSLWPENGCILDPWGRCAPASAQDNGCGLDPNGGCRPGG